MPVLRRQPDKLPGSSRRTGKKSYPWVSGFLQTKTLLILLSIVCIYNALMILAPAMRLSWIRLFGFGFYLVAAILLLGFKSPAGSALVIAYNVIYNVFNLTLRHHVYLNLLDWGLAIPTMVLLNQLYGAYRRFRYTGILPAKKFESETSYGIR